MTRVTTAFIALSIACLAYDANPVFAKRNPGSERLPAISETVTTSDNPPDRASFSIAATTTTLLYSASFDIGATCAAQGWTVVDLTLELGDFWHVEDYQGLSVGPLAGAKSLWCGARPQATGSLCAYATLPGYGNNWDQIWQTKECISVTGELDVSFTMRIDIEPQWDTIELQFNQFCNETGYWTTLDGGFYSDWQGAQEILVNASYPVSASSGYVRFHFESNDSYSDEDGLFDTQAGAVHIDNLQVGGLAVEDFEDESANATSSNDWESNNLPGFGASFMALFPGTSLVQEDACAKNLSCQWAAINGSAESYACGGFPLQAVVPHGDAYGQYLDTAIWSPPIPWAGTGAANLQFSVYRDMTLDGLVFYAWHVRSYTDPTCKGPWRSRGTVYFGPQKDWHTATFPFEDLVAPGATTVEVSLEIVDMCQQWCSVYGSAPCHSHAPLLDNVRVYRVDVFGPTWSVRDIDMFQDTFPSDGTATGVGRADMARNIAGDPYYPTTQVIVPGDSVVLTCVDGLTAVAPTNPSGLADDPGVGGKQIYLYVHCSDPAKSGAILTDTPAHYPFKDIVVADGRMWTRIRCEQTPAPSGRQFRVDLNDALFEGGDIVEFFFGATSTSGRTSYCSGSNLSYVQNDIEVAAQNASEFTILPVHEYSILYVDGMDGRGSQPYWDSAFEHLGLLEWIDRYDVRGPSSNVGNRPASRVANATNQLLYAAILWDCGDIPFSLSDWPSLWNDYTMLNEFLDQLYPNGGVYICGDDVASSINAAYGASAVTFRSTYMPFTLTTGNHRPMFGINPVVVGTPGGPFDNPAFAGDTFVAAGGCPLLNDFDVMTPAGFSQIQMSYGPAGSNNGAVLSKKTATSSPLPVWVTVILSGFSFAYIRDDESDGIMDRADHLSDILRFLTQIDLPPTQAGPAYSTHIEQNYPNPFNPVTTIAFSLATRSRVRIDVFNVAGERVKTLVDETRAAGAYSDVRWDSLSAAGETVASGVYFYKLTTKDFSQTRKMVLLK